MIPMQKQGNNHSELLKSFEKIAGATPPPAKPSFNDQILEALKGAKKPSLQDIIADIARGKNIHRTAQFNSPMPMEAKPMGSPLDNLGGGEDELGAPVGDPVDDIEGGGLEDQLDGVPGSEGIPGDDSARKAGELFLDLAGSPEEAHRILDECSGAEGLGEEGLGDELGGPEEFGPESEVPFDDAGLEEPDPMQPMQPMKSMESPAAPQQMPGLV